MRKIILPVAGLILGLLVSWACCVVFSHHQFQMFRYVPKPTAGMPGACTEIGECDVSWVQGATFLLMLFGPSLVFCLDGIFMAVKGLRRTRIILHFSILIVLTIVYYFTLYET